MSLKELSLAKMEAQFATWSNKMDAMRALLEDADLEGRIEFHRRVDASQQQHEVARRHLDELERSGEEAWLELKTGLEASWKEFTASLKRDAK